MSLSGLARMTFIYILHYYKSLGNWSFFQVMLKLKVWILICLNYQTEGVKLIDFYYSKFVKLDPPFLKKVLFLKNTGKVQCMWDNHDPPPSLNVNTCCIYFKFLFLKKSATYRDSKNQSVFPTSPFFPSLPLPWQREPQFWSWYASFSCIF